MSHDTNRGGGDALDRRTFDCLQAAGWIFPTTPDAIRRSDEALGPPPPLPPELADGGALFDRITAKGATPEDDENSDDHNPSRTQGARIHRHPSAEDREIGEAFARAAREGREIPPEVEERMRRAREAQEVRERAERRDADDQDAEDDGDA